MFILEASCSSWQLTLGFGTGQSAQGNRRLSVLFQMEHLYYKPVFQDSGLMTEDGGRNTAKARAVDGFTKTSISLQ